MGTLSDALNKIISPEKLGEHLVILSQYAPNRPKSPIKKKSLIRRIFQKELVQKIEDLANQMTTRDDSKVTVAFRELASKKVKEAEKHIADVTTTAKGIFLGSTHGISDVIRGAGKVEYNNYANRVIEFLEKLNKCSSDSGYKKLENESKNYELEKVQEDGEKYIAEVTQKCLKTFDEEVENKTNEQLVKMAKECDCIINSISQNKDPKAQSVKKVFENVKDVCESKNKELEEKDIAVLDEIFKGKSRQWKKFTGEADYKNAILPVGGRTNWAIINLISSFIQTEAGFSFKGSINGYITPWEKASPKSSHRESTNSIHIGKARQKNSK